MAVAFETISTSGWLADFDASTFNVDVPKPTGLSEGDIMVGYMVATVQGTTEGLTGINAPTGWTQMTQQTFGNIKIGAWYKTATLADESETNFTFTSTGDRDNDSGVRASILRISGGATPQVWNSAGGSSATGTVTFSNTVTPQKANNLLLFLVGTRENFGITAYSITNDDPTWTEREDSVYDFDGTFEGSMACATALRSEITATGDSTITTSAFNNGGASIMVSVTEPIDASGTTNLITPTTTLNAGTGSVGTNGTAGMTAAGTTTYEIGGEGEADIWTNQNKNTATWTNQNKS